MRQVFSWLHKNGVCVEADHILMRPIGDDAFKPSDELKLILVEGLNVDLFIDDREDVCDAFVAAGVSTLMCRLAS